jgi:membrane protein
MASLGDFKSALRSIGWWSFLKRVVQKVSEDNILVWASALAYSWLFAIFPFLIFLLSLAPFLPEHARQSAENAVNNVVVDLLGKAAPTITDNIHYVLNVHRSGWLGVGLCVALWVASGGMAMTMYALDQCYDLKTSRPYYVQRPLALLLTIVAAACVLALIVLLPIGRGVEVWARRHQLLTMPTLIAFNVSRYILALFFSLIALVTVYHFGPAIRQKFQLLSPGAIFSIIVWFVLDQLFRMYVNRFARYDQTYGTVGGAAILLLFFYIDGLVLLIGAEINSEIDFEVLGVAPGTTDFRRPAPAAPVKIAEEL